MKQFWEMCKKHWPAFLALMLLILVAAFLVANPVMPDRFEVIEGYPLPKNIYSEVDFETLDYEKSEAAGRLAARQAPRCFTLDMKKVDETNRQIDLFVKELEDWAKSENETPADGSVPIIDKSLVQILVNTGRLYDLRDAWKDSVQFGILALPPNKLRPNEKLFISYSSGATRDMLVEHTKYYRKSTMIQRMINDLYGERYQEVNHQNKALETRLGSVISENLTFDEKMSQKKQEAAVENAKIYRQIHRGQLLLEKTNKLTPEDMQLYQSHREALDSDPQRGTSSSVVLYRLGVILALLFFMALYVYQQFPEIANNNRAVWLWCGVILLCLIVFRSVTSGFFLLAEFSGMPQWTVFLVLPLAVPSLLISVIYGYRPAIYIGIFMSGITACTLNNPFAVLLTGVLVSAVSAFMVRSVIHYKQFFMHAFLVCTVATAICSAIFAGQYAFTGAAPEADVTSQQQLLEQSREAEGAEADDDGKVLGIQMFIPSTGELAPLFKHRVRTVFNGLLLIPVISGLTAVLLAQLLLFMLESCFRVTSSMSYLSYTDRNHKLLKELQISAPGTYHHCERVALLAENAASAIGLDRVRVQACALFHDVGKLKYPNMFTENNTPGEENMHKNFEPLQSVNIIKEHVSYGLELGKKNKLPQLLMRAIQSHHGTDFISFFYSNAQKDAAEKGLPEPKEEDFHYNGPLPTDKEVVLIMLADCCEAAVQSIPDLTAEKVQNMVNMLFEKKQKGGQLDGSPLTLKELHIVRKAFEDSLLSMHNKRIAYPDQENKKANKQKGKQKS